MTAYHAFWVKHARLLHLRNGMGDRHDGRMMRHRVRAAQAVMRLLIEQMDGEQAGPESPIVSMATALMTGLERVVTVTTDPNLPMLIREPVTVRVHLLRAEAKLLELGIRDYRRLARGQ